MSTELPWFAPLVQFREPAEEIRAVNLDSLLRTGKFSDLELRCEGCDFAVHKAILCSQSRVLSAACEGGFEESRTNVIKIEEFDAETVKRMLDFLYTGDYTVPKETVSLNYGSRVARVNSDGRSSTFSLDFDESDNEKAVVTKSDIMGWHLRANAIGDYYNIEPLCALSRSKLSIEVDRNWSPVDFVYLLTEACTDRKTGDLKFHQLLGQIMGNHLEDLAGLESFEALDVPGVLLTSIVESSLRRMSSLQRHIKQQQSTIQSLVESKSAVEAQLRVSMAQHVHRGGLFG